MEIKGFQRFGAASTRGQSLVEMAIIAPLLIFFLLGIFEVGWALRSYLVLVNVNREITRFAIRPGYLNFSSESNISASYDRVKEWARSSVSEQLNMDFDSPNAATTLIISHVVVDTGKPCENPTDAGCSDCEAFKDPAHNPFPQDDLIISPVVYDYQQERFGPSTTVTGPRDSRIDFATLTNQLRARNNEFNCQIMNKGGVPGANNVIVTELFHDQPQLFGFPLISNPFTDPLPLYTHTTMRLINATRSAGGGESNIAEQIDTIGPVCLVYPFLVDANDVSSGAILNITEHGWLKWGGMFSDPVEYMANAVIYPHMSLNDYSSPEGVKIGSTVTKVDSIVDADGDVANALTAIEGSQIIIPISNSPGSNPVTVNGFVYVTTTAGAIDLTNNPNVIMAQVNTSESLPLACNSSPPP